MVISLLNREVIGIHNASVIIIAPYDALTIYVERLSAFMQHVPNIDILIVETEKIAVGAIYEELKGMRLNRKCLLKPNEKEYSLYGTGGSCIIVREIISEAPVIDVNGIPMASLEKILVDAQLLPELEFARGAELYTIQDIYDTIVRLMAEQA
jgi:hypothetical protein